MEWNNYCLIRHFFKSDCGNYEVFFTENDTDLDKSIEIIKEGYVNMTRGSIIKYNGIIFNHVDSYYC